MRRLVLSDWFIGKTKHQNGSRGLFCSLLSGIGLFRGGNQDEQCEDSGKYGMGTVYLGRAKIYPLGLWVISTSASTGICGKEEDRACIKPSVSLLQYTAGLEQRLLCLLVHHS